MEKGRGLFYIVGMEADLRRRVIKLALCYNRCISAWHLGSDSYRSAYQGQRPEFKIGLEKQMVRDPRDNKEVGYDESDGAGKGTKLGCLISFSRSCCMEDEKVEENEGRYDVAAAMKDFLGGHGDLQDYGEDSQGLHIVFALLLRPKKDHKYRLYWNIYHHVIDYTVIILSVINIFKGFDILDPERKWKHAYIAIIVTLGGIAVALEAITWGIVLKRKRSDSSDKSHRGTNGVNGLNSTNGYGASRQHQVA
ncbi:hypothetical protein MA16_Dca019550 [Dendrobium catenatum]|uniref:Uncharacterized protein n=1 Tax=Dendrobium catenatum TaxID=906689 RepID=A0A2I0XAH1_9ASPA|nr:hypothetical protein MA16_Dca019550 [Dendrobium catenatum]